MIKTLWTMINTSAMVYMYVYVQIGFMCVSSGDLRAFTYPYQFRHG